MKKITLIRNKTCCINPKGYFYHSTNGKLVNNKTLIFLKFIENFLIIHFWGNNNFFLKNNNYKNIYGRENQPLYNQEVFEVFIAAGKEAPTHYLEININPNNAIYVSKIINQDKNGNNNQNFLFSNKVSKKNSKKIQHSICRNINKNTWSAKLKIPLEIIAEDKAIQQFYRLNFFRIRSKEFLKNKNWQCSPANCEFSCWNSTYSKNQPKFHRSEYMGLLEIKK